MDGQMDDREHMPSPPVIGDTDLYYIFIQILYRRAYSNCMFIMSPPTSLLTYLQKWRQVLLNGVGLSVVVIT